MKNQPKSKAKQHGGKREGAGRKPKPRAPAIPVRMVSGDTSAQDLAKAYLALAIETLASVAGAGASEAARVAAARVIIETAIVRPKATPGAAEQRPQDDADGWDGLLERRPAVRAN
jgi:hypothetical protein